MSIYQLADLRHIMQRLRQECPWDRAQTPQSLSRYAIEEAYEVEAAIRSGDHVAIRDELGDLLLQVVFQAQLFSESPTGDTSNTPHESHQSSDNEKPSHAAFNFDDIVNGLAHKLIRRHPHVFGDQQAHDAQQVNQLWEQVKLAERKGVQRRLDEIKPGPALNQAQDLQKQAAKLGFDWPDIQGAKDKLHEELAELEQAIASQQPAQIEDELGDCFFALVNVARKLNVQSETALLGTIHKFRHRFAYIEDQLAAQGKTPEQSNLAEMDQLWDQAKIQLKK